MHLACHAIASYRRSIVFLANVNKKSMILNERRDLGSYVLFVIAVCICSLGGHAST